MNCRLIKYVYQGKRPSEWWIQKEHSFWIFRWKIFSWWTNVIRFERENEAHEYMEIIAGSEYYEYKTKWEKDNSL